MKKVFNPTTGEFDYVGEDSVKVNRIDNAGIQQGNLTMEPNNRYVFSSPVGLLRLFLQDVSETGRAYVYELDFVTGDNVSIRTPGDISWVKRPVFSPGKRYLISIDISVVGGEKQIIGMYLEMEA